ncbi:DUF262 domain-containing protein [uncultured Parolsenella sp.]|uniref:DUF262 domain-containing protein n=1 Tax=uncultured Parolsenella sp. TaxID=2083008 RepID=UPI0025E4D043|nr:DUF262 domain-containing protein [uncultured Parolsenella sp.]
MTAQYDTITLGVSDLDRITLPKFQRGFVWNKTKKTSFIQTLHDGFPFGALLVYPETSDADSKLVLLDGQQRLSTILQYQHDQIPFWKPLNFDKYQSCLTSINSMLDEEHQVTEETFDRLLTNKIDVADWADEVAPSDAARRKDLRDKIKELQTEIAQFVDLNELGILAIKFTGSRDRIADVFANLNKGGMPLQKYEVFSAAWSNTEIRLLQAGESANGLQDKILEYVKSYYSSMETKAEFELNDFSEDELSKSRVITLSEFAVALGAFVHELLPSLVGDTLSTQNEIGYGLLGIATGTDNRKLSTLNSKVDLINDELQLILEKASRICVDLNGIFSKLLNQIIAGKKDTYVPGLTSSFKTLSYFASLWNLEESSEEYRTTLKNIPSYYVFDFWSRSWTSHGDQRLIDYYPKYGKRNYLQRLTLGQLLDAYAQWASDNTPGINFSKEVKALTTIHSNQSYLSSVLPHGESFELEHIIAKKLINAAENDRERRIFAGSLGNCMYLPRQDNNKKKEKNLYDVNQEGRYNDLMASSLYYTKEEFATISNALEVRDYATINALIMQRGHRVAESIAQSLLG